MVGFLNPYPKAQGFGDRMRGLLDPEVALPVAGALLGNQGNAANFGNALMGLGQGLGDRKKRNQTMEYLRREAPDLADAIESGGMGDPRLLSGGISEALVTTAAGLCVAIPSLIAFRFLRGRVERLVALMEKDAGAFIDSLEDLQGSDDT